MDSPFPRCEYQIQHPWQVKWSSRYFQWFWLNEKDKRTLWDPVNAAIRAGQPVSCLKDFPKETCVSNLVEDLVAKLDVEEKEKATMKKLISNFGFETVYGFNRIRWFLFRLTQLARSDSKTIESMRERCHELEVEVANLKTQIQTLNSSLEVSKKRKDTTLVDFAKPEMPKKRKDTTLVDFAKPEMPKKRTLADFASTRQPKQPSEKQILSCIQSLATMGDNHAAGSEPRKSLFRGIEWTPRSGGAWFVSSAPRIPAFVSEIEAALAYDELFKSQLAEEQQNFISTTKVSQLTVVTMKDHFRGIFTLFANACDDERIGRRLPDCVLSADAWEITRDVALEDRVKFLTNIHNIRGSAKRLQICGVGVSTKFGTSFVRLKAFLPTGSWQVCSGGHIPAIRRHPPDLVPHCRKSGSWRELVAQE